MKDRLNGHHVGMVLGAFAVVVHIIWTIMIALGIGQTWMDWIFGLHMITNPITVITFSWGTAVLLWIVVLVVGYILGHIFAWVHNLIHKK
ncbi:MAG: hypothetical protein WC553_00640 [Patescibacteria group bacterium]|jgi:hypothetical protein